VARYALASYYYSAEVGSLERKFSLKSNFVLKIKFQFEHGRYVHVNNGNNFEIF
jgi:hypothetical protein